MPGLCESWILVVPCVMPLAEHVHVDGSRLQMAAPVNPGNYPRPDAAAFQPSRVLHLAA